MFDIDGTLVKSYELDSKCFVESVKDVTGVIIDSDWSKYRHVTDSGILNEIMERNHIDNGQEVCERVKAIFLEKLQKSIANEPVEQISGAAEFIAQLASMNHVVISLATGGWYESAVLKLESAGINFSSIPLLSSSDHESRVEIMRAAVSSIKNSKDYPCTYFGDGSWDKKACDQLGFSFVLVGNKISHRKNIKDFLSFEKVLECIGI
tara:strand:- start:1729 stop:2352 length:624 start_codon:yes stop_codon:yes gene_type:complete